MNKEVEILEIIKKYNGNYITDIDIVYNNIVKSLESILYSISQTKEKIENYQYEISSSQCFLSNSFSELSYFNDTLSNLEKEYEILLSDKKFLEDNYFYKNK